LVRADIGQEIRLAMSLAKIVSFLNPPESSPALRDSASLHFIKGALVKEDKMERK